MYTALEQVRSVGEPNPKTSPAIGLEVFQTFSFRRFWPQDCFSKSAIIPSINRLSKGVVVMARNSSFFEVNRAKLTWWV